jgi:hypothetical protein
MSDRNWHRTNLWERESIAIAVAVLLLILAVITSGCQMIPTDQFSDSGGPDGVPDEQAEPTDFPPGFPTPDPDEFAACLADGGRWEVLGFSGPGCNLPTEDGGKPCTGSEECESGCLGDPNEVMSVDGSGQPFPEPDRLAELNTQVGDRVGMCSPWVENFGCRVWVEKGHYVAICVD